MEVVSHGPLRALGLRFRPRAGAYALAVIAKATYDLRPVCSPLAEQQEDVNEGDNHWDDDDHRSVYAPTDLAPFKARADVVLVGDAYAPHGEAVPRLTARLVAGTIDKSIEVVGDRGFGSGGAPRDPQPFAKMPLLYERAAAGPDNPVGVRVDASARRSAAPNLLRPGAIVARDASIDGVGFGPIAPRWPSRARILGPLAASWSSASLGEPLPEGFPPAFFNVAPADQQIERLAADQHFVLENLSAEHPLLVTNLPGVRARAFVLRAGEVEEVQLTADTLWIDTSRQIATLVFRGQLLLAAAGERGTVVVVAEEAQRPLPWVDVVRLCEGAARGGLPRLGDDEPVVETAAVDPGALAQSLRAAPAFLAPRRAAPWAERDETIPVDLRREGGHGVDVDGSSTATELPPGLADASPAWLASSPPASAAGRSPALGAVVAAPAVVGLHARAAVDPGVAARVAAPDLVAEAPPAAAPSPASVPPPPAPVPPPPGLFALSNAAAAQHAPAPAPPLAPPTEPAPAPPPSIDPRRIAHEREHRQPPELVELLWFDAAALEAIRKEPRWKDLIASLAPKPPPVAYDDDEVLPEEPPATKDRRDLFGVLTLSSSDGPDDLDGLVDAAGGERGGFTPPLALLGGEIAFPFDEIETLRATLTSVAPFTASDKKLKELVDTAHELLKTPWLSGSGAVVDGILGRVRDQFAVQSRGLAPGHLDAVAERILLEQRHFQRRTVFGEPHLRALLTAAPGTPPLVTYLPDALAKKLPMFQRLRARLVVEVHVSQDQFEASPIALRTVVLARAFPRPSRQRR